MSEKSENKNHGTYHCITERYCRFVGGNVIVECTHGAERDEFTCIADYCGNCKNCERYSGGGKLYARGAE